jgi:phosphoribosylanthranilate isomerase
MKNSKEKALELVHQYDLMQTYIEGFSFEDAKQCALIAVDEILDIVQYNGDDEYAYWQQVKTEINNL